VPSATVAVFSASYDTGHEAAARELIRRLRDRGFGVERFDFVDAPCAVTRPREICDYPDPVTVITDRIGLNRTPLASVA